MSTAQNRNGTTEHFLLRVIHAWLKHDEKNHYKIIHRDRRIFSPGNIAQGHEIQLYKDTPYVPIKHSHIHIYYDFYDQRWLYHITFPKFDRRPNQRAWKHFRTRKYLIDTLKTQKGLEQSILYLDDKLSKKINHVLSEIRKYNSIPYGHLHNQNENKYISPPKTPSKEEQMRIQQELQRQQQKNAYMKQLAANHQAITQIRKMLIIRRKANKNASMAENKKKQVNAIVNKYNFLEREQTLEWILEQFVKQGVVNKKINKQSTKNKVIEKSSKPVKAVHKNQSKRSKITKMSKALKK